MKTHCMRESFGRVCKDEALIIVENGKDVVISEAVLIQTLKGAYMHQCLLPAKEAVISALYGEQAFWRLKNSKREDVDKATFLRLWEEEVSARLENRQRNRKMAGRKTSYRGYYRAPLMGSELRFGLTEEASFNDLSVVVSGRVGRISPSDVFPRKRHVERNWKRQRRNQWRAG